MNGLNHRTVDDIDLALIEGTKIRPFCNGEPFNPRLRVGSGGKADNPALPSCPRCDRITEILIARRKAKDEYNRLAREIRALEKEHREILKGAPLRIELPSEVTV